MEDWPRATGIFLRKKGKFGEIAKKEAVQSWPGRRNGQHHILAAVADSDRSVELAADFSIFSNFFGETGLTHLYRGSRQKRTGGGCASRSGSGRRPEAPEVALLWPVEPQNAFSCGEVGGYLTRRQNDAYGANKRNTRGGLSGQGGQDDLYPGALAL